MKAVTVWLPEELFELIASEWSEEVMQHFPDKEIRVAAKLCRLAKEACNNDHVFDADE